MIHSRDFLIKIYNAIYIWNQQELLYKMVYKLYDLVKVGQKPPFNGHGPFPKYKSSCNTFFKINKHCPKKAKFTYMLFIDCNTLTSHTPYHIFTFTFHNLYRHTFATRVIIIIYYSFIAPNTFTLVYAVP
jgi:hypothetical protein